MNASKRWIADALERAGRTFLQFYLGLWLLRAGLLGSDVSEDHVGAFDLLFTMDNLKAGVVGLALSLAFSIGAKPVGAPDSASLLPADVDPPQGE